MNGEFKFPLWSFSLHQPFASLMADGRKPIETRHWPAPAWLIGQHYAIHAAKHVDLAACEMFGYDPKTIVRGCIVSIHSLERCVQFTEQNRNEFADDYGNYEPGRWGWISPLWVKLDEPVAIRGHQGLWRWYGTFVAEDSIIDARTAARKGL